MALRIHAAREVDGGPDGESRRGLAMWRTRAGFCDSDDGVGALRIGAVSLCVFTATRADGRVGRRVLSFSLSGQRVVNARVTDGARVGQVANLGEPTDLYLEARITICIGSRAWKRTRTKATTARRNGGVGTGCPRLRAPRCESDRWGSLAAGGRNHQDC